MTRIHSTLIALVLGAAAAAGLYAAVNTVRLGQKASVPSISRHDLAARQAKLSSWNRSLGAALAKRPPALPKVPHFAPAPVPAPVQQAAAPPTVATAQPHVTYVHAPTVVVYKHAPTPTTTTPTGSGDDGSGDDSSGDGGGD